MDSPGVYWGPISSPEKIEILATHDVATPRRPQHWDLEEGSSPTPSDPTSPHLCLLKEGVSSYRERPSRNSSPQIAALTQLTIQTAFVLGSSEDGITQGTVEIATTIQVATGVQGAAEEGNLAAMLTVPNPRLLEMVSQSPLTIQQGPKPSTESTDSGDGLEADLMSFQSLSTPNITPSRAHEPVTPQNHIQDLLEPSPAPASTPRPPLPHMLPSPKLIPPATDQLTLSDQPPPSPPLLTDIFTPTPATPVKQNENPIPTTEDSGPESPFTLPPTGVQARKKRKLKDPAQHSVASSSRPQQRIVIPPANDILRPPAPRSAKKPPPLKQVGSLSPTTASLLSAFLPLSKPLSLLSPPPPSPSSHPDVTTSRHAPAPQHEVGSNPTCETELPRIVLPHAPTAPIFGISESNVVDSVDNSNFRETSPVMGTAPSRIPRPGNKPYSRPTISTSRHAEPGSSPMKPSRIPSPIKFPTIFPLSEVSKQPPIAALSFPTPSHIQSILNIQGPCSDERPVAPLGDAPLSHPVLTPTLPVVDVPEQPLPRRAMRTRKNSGDVSDHENPEPVQPSKKRKAPPSNRGPVKRVAYEGIPTDPTALRSLTTSNTNKNMKYVSTLDVLVVHKEGNRPESPTSKVRSILEKGQENGTKTRGERAKRRAGIKIGADEGSSDKADDDDSVQDSESTPRKHPRAPGDVEDYETPIRPAKRPRLDAVDDAQDPHLRKSVKWNKELQKYWVDGGEGPLDQNTADAPVSVFVKKSCLAAAAKALNLDTLGNVPDAGLPLLDVESEQIIVTKFVYEDDEPPKPVRKPATRKKATPAATSS